MCSSLYPASFIDSSLAHSSKDCTSFSYRDGRAGDVRAVETAGRETAE